MEENDSSTDRIRVTQTGTPASRRRRTSSSRFSSWLATTRSGARAMIAAVSGFLVPRIRGDVEVGRDGAPVGGGDDGVASAGDERLGERRHQADDATCRPRHGDERAQVVDGHASVIDG